MHDVIHARRERRKREKEFAPQAVFMKKEEKKGLAFLSPLRGRMSSSFLQQKNKKEKRKRKPLLRIFPLLHRKNDGKSFPFFFLKQKREKTWNKIIVLF